MGPHHVVHLRFTPYAVKAWREENELAGRDLMADGVRLARAAATVRQHGLTRGRAGGRRSGAHDRLTALSPAPAPVTAIAPSMSVRSTTAPPALSASTVRGAG